MTKDLTQKYRISITHSTVEDLEALRYAFEGKMEHGEHQNCSDDVLVAALLGWHFRSFQAESWRFAKALAYEFSIRQQLLNDPSDSWVDEKLRRQRSFFRGSPSTPGNVLTLDGINQRTLRRIEARSHSVEMMVRALNNGSGKGISERLRRYSDQAIIDLGVWWTLANSGMGNTPELEPYPHWVKDEIRGRGQARAEYDAGTLGDSTAGFPEGGCSTVQQVLELPPLSRSDRAAFFRQRRILDKDQFWSDDRIRAAMGMGL